MAGMYITLENKEWIFKIYNPKFNYGKYASIRGNNSIKGS